MDRLHLWRCSRSVVCGVRMPSKQPVVSAASSKYALTKKEKEEAEKKKRAEEEKKKKEEAERKKREEEEEARKRAEQIPGACFVPAGDNFDDKNFDPYADDDEIIPAKPKK